MNDDIDDFFYAKKKMAAVPAAFEIIKNEFQIHYYIS